MKRLSSFLPLSCRASATPMEAKAAHSQRSDGSLAVWPSSVRATTPSECSRVSAVARLGRVAVSSMLHSFREYLGASTANARRSPSENDQIDYFIVRVRLRVVKAFFQNLSGFFLSRDRPKR